MARTKRVGNFIITYDDSGREISRKPAALTSSRGAFAGYNNPQNYQTPNIDPGNLIHNVNGPSNRPKPTQAGGDIAVDRAIARGTAKMPAGTGPYDPNVARSRGMDTTGAALTGGGTGGGTDVAAATAEANADAITDAANPFSALVKDAQLRAAWENPEALINLYARKSANLDPSGGGEAELQRLAPSLGILWMIMNDMAGKGELSDEAGGLAGSRDYVNWMGPSLDTMRNTAGGSILSNPGGILSTLLNPTGETLQTYLGAGGEGAANLTRTDQVDNMINAARYALEPTLPTPTLNALLNVLSVKGRQYVADQLMGDTEGSFPELMRSALGG